MDKTTLAFWGKRVGHAVVALFTIGLTSVVIAATLMGLGLTGIMRPSMVKLALQWLPMLSVVGLGLVIGHRVSYRMLLPVLVASVAGVIYLAWDDREAPPAPDPGRVIAEDDAGYRIYRWFLKDDPMNRLGEVPKGFDALPRFPSKKDDWPQFLKTNREAYDAAWEEAALGRAWIEGMAAMKADGIFQIPTLKAPMPAFLVIRDVTQLYWARAGLLDLDGHADEAAKTLFPLLLAAQRLQRSGSTLVVQMIAVVLLKGTQERLGLILDGGRLSPAVRAEMASILRAAPPMSTSIDNAFLGEQVFARSAFEINFENLPDQPAIKHFACLLYNSNRTKRQYAAMVAQANNLARIRAIGELKELAQTFEGDLRRWHWKNPMGRVLETMISLSFQKAVKNFWLAEDQRVALIVRLAHE